MQVQNLTANVLGLPDLKDTRGNQVSLAPNGNDGDTAVLFVTDALASNDLQSALNASPTPLVQYVTTGPDALTLEEEVMLGVTAPATAAGAQSLVDGEASNRSAGDAANTAAIAGEASNRSAGDAANRAAIAGEASLRSAGDAAQDAKFFQGKATMPAGPATTIVVPVVGIGAAGNYVAQASLDVTAAPPVVGGGGGIIVGVVDGTDQITISTFDIAGAPLVAAGQIVNWSVKVN